MSLYDNTIGVSLIIHKFGNSQGVDKDTLRHVMPDVSEAALREYLHTTRKLVVAEEFQAINTLDTAFMAWVKQQSVPSHFRGGIYLVPEAFIQELWQRVKEYEAQRQELVERLGEVWEQRWQESQAATAGQFGWLPCPDWGKVSGRFWVDCQTVTIDVPGRLQYIMPKEYESMQLAMRERLVQVERDIEVMLLSEACAQTEVLLKRLQGLGDGTTKKFFSSHVTGLQEWCRVFIAGRNVTGYAELEQQAKQLGGVLEQIVGAGGSVPVEVLRNNGAYREYIVGQLQEIGGVLQGMVENAPVRVIALDDLE